MNLQKLFERNLAEHQASLDSLTELLPRIQAVAELLSETARQRKHLFICGNGGSASDALHWSGEWRGRFEKNRVALKATSLSADVGSLTCIGNDYGYDQVFARQLEALAEPGDVLLAISTSGNSENVLQAVATAKKISLTTIGFLGRDGGKLLSQVDHPVVIPVERTSHIQEMHEFLMHVLCEYVDREMGVYEN